MKFTAKWATSDYPGDVVCNFCADIFFKNIKIKFFKGVYMSNVTNKDKLDGRIYPAIKNCVNNRYRIITGIFTYYAFLLSDLSNNFPQLKAKIIGSFIPFVFLLFILHNFLNYRENAKVQHELENEGEKYSKLSCCKRFEILNMEIYSLIISSALVIAGYFSIIFFDC